MRWRPILGICCGVVAILAVCPRAVDAQAGGSIFVTPIPHAPFSATVRVERTDIQPNGTSLALWSEREIARDNDGRIYNEFRPFVPAAAKNVPDATVIHLYDPQNRMTEYLYPERKTYRMSILNRPPSTDTPDDFASPTSASAPPNAFARKEDLGYRKIAGLDAHGVRMTQTLPAEESGTGREVMVTNEYWYSEALRLNLATKHNDPRTGSVTTTVIRVDRSEPSPELFSVPADYTMAGLGKPAEK